MRRIIGIIAIFLASIVPANAANHIDALRVKYDSSKKIVAKIGRESQTRISFGKFGIKEVIGDLAKYTLVHDNAASSVYLIPKVKCGDKIDITVISSSGKTQDLMLEVTEGRGNVIIIDTDFVGAFETENPREAYNKEKQLEEAVLMLGYMAKGAKGKYAIRECKAAKSPHTASVRRSLSFSHTTKKDLLITLEREYAFKLYGLKGYVLRIANKSRGAIDLTEDDLNNLFGRIIVSSIKDHNLKPKETTFAYVAVSDSFEDGERGI